MTSPRVEPTGPADATNPAYVDWLRAQSMLAAAERAREGFVASGRMWRQPFAIPDPARAVAKAPVWVTAYPSSMITRPGQSFLGALGEPALWEALTTIGVTAVHTGPVKLSGGVSGWDLTPSVDGNFDRISTEIDPASGTQAEFRAMCEVAARHGGIVLDDIVPGHTGKGADFRLAEMGVGDYPGIFHMVQIEPADWPLLPTVAPGRDAANLDEAAETALRDAGYIVGALQRVIFAEPGVKDTNWSATPEVVGPDGVTRRWVYLHYFKEGQPSLNWLDPTFAASRLVLGDALHSLGTLGAGALRLDANGFLGIERGAEGEPAWSEGHPLSNAANQLIAGLVRKVGGFTFQELNLTIEDIATTSALGADLSYDFVNRPAYHHALAVGDTSFLRLTLSLAIESGVSTGALVHALQNHDELTYELVHFADKHRDDVFTYRGEALRGADLAVRIRGDLVATITGPAGGYNAVCMTNGISSTTASVIASSLGFGDLDGLSDADIGLITQAHLLLVMFNALQPGVFALSGWDLCGVLPLRRDQVASLIADGDTRWINRGAYDLVDADPEATSSLAGMPRGRSLYGSLPTQLADPLSFASRLRGILDVRARLGLATGRQVAVPEVPHHALLLMVHTECADGATTATLLNFSGATVTATLHTAHLPEGLTATDALTGTLVGVIGAGGSLEVTVSAYDGMCLTFAHA